MIKYTITVEGKTLDDVETAIDQVKELVHEGYQQGFVKSDHGSYHFTSEGVPLADYFKDEE